MSVVKVLTEEIIDLDGKEWIKRGNTHIDICIEILNMYFLSGYDASTLSIYQKTTITNKVYQYFSLKNKTYCSLLER